MSEYVVHGCQAFPTMSAFVGWMMPGSIRNARTYLLATVFIYDININTQYLTPKPETSSVTVQMSGLPADCRKATKICLNNGRTPSVVQTIDLGLVCVYVCVCVCVEMCV